MFFAIVYIHLFRGLYYGSYKEPRQFLWILGVVILILMIATAFMGYVLPWGQNELLGHGDHQPVLGDPPTARGL
jgi:ubiquinol-cytochrome c reductase cytochrome b subunit